MFYRFQTVSWVKEVLKPKDIWCNRECNFSKKVHPHICSYLVKVQNLLWKPNKLSSTANIITDVFKSVQVMDWNAIVYKYVRDAHCNVICYLFLEKVNSVKVPVFI